MNNLKISKLTFIFQDLITQNQMPTLGKFKNNICTNVIIFPNGQLEKIYAFIETIQKHPKRGGLSIALKPMFKMLFDYMVNRGSVNVYHKKKDIYYSNIKYNDIFKMFKVKKIIQKGYKSYIIPYKPHASTFINQREEYYSNLYNYWDSFSVDEYEDITEKICTKRYHNLYEDYLNGVGEEDEEDEENEDFYL